MAQVTVHEAELPNGLKIVAEHNPFNKSASLGYFVRTGARDESVRESGLSHFLEHMMFKGTPTRSAIDITYQLGNLGAQANAYTSEETTVFYASVVPEYVPQMHELLSDMMRPALDQQEFDTEKKVILEEIALYQDRPNYYLFEHALEEYFADHPAGKSVLGSTKSVGDVTRDEMKSYFDRRYAPSNMVLAISGNFDWKQFRADTEKHTAKWKKLECPRELPPFKGRVVQKTFHKKNLNQAHLLFMMVGPTAQDEARYPANVLATILGDGVASKFYWQLVDKGIAESASLDVDEHDGCGVQMAYACMEPGLLDKVSGIMQSIMSKPLDFSDADLERAKTKIASRIVLSGESSMGRMMGLGNEWIYRKRVSNLRETIEKIKAVTRADIERTLTQYPLSGWSEFRLLPG